MMKVRINSDAFSGETLSRFNGAVVTKELDQIRRESILGASGETMAFTPASGGRLYLSPNQYEVIEQ